MGVPFQEAAEDLCDLIEDLRQPEPQAPADREGLGGWAKNWKQCHGGDPKACEILLDAMAQYTLHLKAQGASPRKMAGVYSDLDAAGMLVMSYHAPKGKKVLDSFSYPPCRYEFKRKFSDSPRAIARYDGTLKDFVSFLREAGLISNE